MSRHNIPPDYESKFADFLRLCEAAKKNHWGGVTLAYPWVLGETYDEVMESLSRLAAAGLSLTIAKPNRVGDENTARALR